MVKFLYSGTLYKNNVVIKILNLETRNHLPVLRN